MFHSSTPESLGSRNSLDIKPSSAIRTAVLGVMLLSSFTALASEESNGEGTESVQAEVFQEPVDKTVLFEDPIEAMKSIEQWKKEPWALELLKLVLGGKPELVLNRYEDYHRESYANELLEQSFRQTLLRDPITVLKRGTEIIYKPYFKEVMPLAGRMALEVDPASVIYYSAAFSDNMENNIKGGEEIFKLAVERAPWAAIEYFNKGLVIYGFRDLIGEVAQQQFSPKLVLDNWAVFANSERALSLINKATDKEPGYALSMFLVESVIFNINKYTIFPDILAYAINTCYKKDPQAILNNESILNEFKWGKKMVIQAKEKIKTQELSKTLSVQKY